MSERVGACPKCLKIKKFSSGFRAPTKEDYVNISKFGISFETCPDCQPKPKEIETPKKP